MKQYIAEFIVMGNYDLWDGISFAPILVLRNPPGGLSTASYTNVQTTIAVTTENMQVMAGYNAGMELGFMFESKVDTSVGGGFGAIVLACNKLLGVKENILVEV